MILRYGNEIERILVFLKTSLNTEHGCLPESVNAMMVGVDILDLAACKDGETGDKTEVGGCLLGLVKISSLLQRNI